MSRLDYITIAIVGICILAIIFLVYKMTDLFGGKAADDKIENAEGRVETETDDTYDMEADDTTDLSGTAETDTEATPTPSTSGGGTTTTTPATTTTPMTADDAEAEDDVATDDEKTTSTISDSGGRYLVIAGTFSKKSLGNNQVAKLKKMGYDNASLEIFDRGKFAVVLVDRFEDMASAEKLIAKLKKDGVNSYVKVKERG